MTQSPQLPNPHRSTLSHVLYYFSFASATPCESYLLTPRVLYLLGTVSALIAGACIPAIDLLFGYWSQAITVDSSNDNIGSRSRIAAGATALIGVVAVASSFSFSLLFSLASNKASQRLRRTYVASILSQDATFHSVHGPGELSMRASRDVDTIRTAYGEKLSYIVWASSTLVTAVIMAFVKAPLVAAVLFGLFPLLIVLLATVAIFVSRAEKEFSELSSGSSSFVEQVLSAIRVAQGFTIEANLVQALHDRYLKPLATIVTQQSLAMGLETGIGYFIVFCVYVVLFAWGGHLVSVRPELEIGNVFTTFWNIFNVLYSLAILSPHIAAFFNALPLLRSMRDSIERTPLIDIRSDKGKRNFPTSNTCPSIQLRNVTFSYPSRPNVASLDNVTLDIPGGQWTAIVGPSGSGKSTVANLLSREYDVDALESASIGEVAGMDVEAHETTAKGAVQVGGQVLLAGQDLREYNVSWLRSKVCVIGQTSHIFSDTVLNNVALGLELGSLDVEMIRDRCIKALQSAQAWSFISKLPNGIDTVLKESTLSGGQKQRLALARAFFRQPSVLVLDEATSALDAATEAAVWKECVQQLRDRGTTVIVIAHRLATIRHADQIVVMKSGTIVEQGTHHELKEIQGGLYREMVQLQTGTGSAPSATISTVEDGSVGASSETQTESSLSFKSEKSSTFESHIKQRPRKIRTNWSLLANYMSKEWYYFVLGIAGALVLGATQVITFWKVGDALQAVSTRNKDSSLTWSLWFLLLSAIVGLGAFAGSYFLEAGSQRMALSMRQDATRALLCYPISFFETREEDKDRSAGALSAALDTYPNHIAAASGLVLNIVLVSAGTCLGNTILALVLSWKVALPMLAPVSLLIFAGWFNMVMLQKSEQRAGRPSQRAASLVAESAAAMRTVNALGVERLILGRFDEQALNPEDMKRTVAPLVWGSVGFAGGQGLLFWLLAFFFWWAGKNVVDDEIDNKTVFSVLEALLLVALSAGKLFTFNQDFGRASNALNTLREWLDDADLETDRIKGHTATDQGTDTSTLHLSDVEMRYPGQDTHTLLGLNLTVQPGQTVALCGPSGSGKSSVLSLIERFYDPASGSIRYGGQLISTMSTAEWRRRLALVPQEPSLFHGTLRWNIALGGLDGGNVSDQAIENALQQASILDFVRSLPEGLDTDLGMRGSALSGGQKQRLCLARALIRRPQILILDEPTSALDPQSEASVQAALSRLAIENDTKMSTIVVAHRLSTIRSADVICVVKDGSIVQRGTHDELISVPGPYLDLTAAQL